MSEDQFVFDPSNPLKLKRARPLREDTEETIDPEDELLNQDVGGNQRTKRRPRKGIDVSQYNDDSSDESSDDVPVDGEKKGNGGGDSDSDMFSSDDENEGEKPKEKEKRAKVNLLDIDKFEEDLRVDDDGEIDDIVDSEEDKSNDSESEEDDEEEESQGDDERQDGRRRLKKDPKKEKFSLKEERETGVFDDEGNYIPVEAAVDEDKAQDEWLGGIKKKEIKLAKKAQQERERLEKENIAKRGTQSIEELLFVLIGLLQPVESPLEALQRLNKKRPKKNSRKVELTPDQLKEEELRQSQVIQITEVSESLIEKGLRDIYELEKEELMIKYKQETGKSYVKPKEEESISVEETGTTDEGQWEFRWIGDDAVHGPHSAYEMNYWKDNYFENRVEVRKVGVETAFIHIQDIAHF